VATHSALTPHPQGFMKPYRSKLQAIARFLDASIVFFSLYGVLYFCGLSMVDVYVWCGALASILFAICTENFELYSLWRGAKKREEAKRILLAWLITVAVLAVTAIFCGVTTSISRKAIGIWIVTAPVSIMVLHIVRRKFLTLLRRTGRNSRHFAVVGATSLGAKLATTIEEMDWLGYKNFGFYDDRDQAENRGIDAQAFEKRNGNYDQLLNDIHEGKIDFVYIALPLAAEPRIQKLVDRLADTTVSVFMVPDFSVFNPIRVRWNTVQGIPVVSLYDTPFGEYERSMKRMMDVVLSSLILCVIAIPMLVIALAVKYTSPGPVFFKQRRYGVGGKPIEVWKFRSMTATDNGDVVKQATKNDARITPLGGFLRRTSLDELPQFINVLQGTMSIVGPRPHAAAHNEYYRKQVTGYMQRHKVKPGITGLAQVNGCRGETDTDEKMEARVKYDLQYINHWSLWLDIKIFFQTFFKGFVGKNAY
tara:strand:- start:2867 stop:4300 length:1434 start_codon:yes stop_codon:yes gene_type:complete